MSLESMLNEYACPSGIWDEMCDAGKIRNHYNKVVSSFQKLGADLAAGRITDRDLLIILVGIAALILIIVAVR